MVGNLIESPNSLRRSQEQAGWEEFRGYLTGFDPQELSDIQLAYGASQAAFRGAKPRASGDSAFSHSRETAIILLKAGVKDSGTIVLGLFHDVDEDTDYFRRLGSFGRDSWDIIATAFSSQEIPWGLDFLTEPDRDILGLTKEQAENLYHQRFIGLSERVLLVKMADRLHNLRTLQAMPIEKQRKKVEETVNVYFPLFRNVVKAFPKEGGVIMEEIKKTITELGYTDLLRITIEGEDFDMNDAIFGHDDDFVRDLL